MGTIVSSCRELTSAEDATALVSQTGLTENAPAARIDFAFVVDKQFVAYGWVLGLATSIASAFMRLGNVVIDLTKEAIQTRRADVALHFSIDPGNDGHGFYALVNLPDPFTAVDHLVLSVTLASGKTSESRWPVCFSEGPVSMRACVPTLNKLLRQLPENEAQRLREFLIVHMALENPGTLPPPLRFEVDMCCVLEGRLLVVYGWLLDPASQLESAQFRVGGFSADFLKNLVRVARPDISEDPFLGVRGRGARLPGFVFVQALPKPETQAREAVFVITAGAETVMRSQPICCDPREARREFLAILSKTDAGPSLTLNRLVAGSVDDSPEEHSLYALLELNHRRTVERLPSYVQHLNPRFALHVDKAVAVAEQGIFLVGWFNAEPAASSAKVVCHCGRLSFVLNDQWIRHLRTDVTSHLAGVGIQPSNHDHGYSCYVPLKEGDAPYYLSIAEEAGDGLRMRVTVSEKAESALDTVRNLLGFLNCEHRNFRFMMESHVGPAVVAVWAARHKPSQQAVVRTFGPRRSDSAVSVIVPLYGRHDFAEYQMALFANDPEFKNIELIYVVDDPAIFDEFRNQCADLYRLYQVPFVLVFPGANLGFAGANNCGANTAYGEFLIFVNSDVLPKRAGWVGELLRIYKSVARPGLLGAKLLYEDGSVQHAGMMFRRHSPWDDMWINDHPFKGQSPLELSGIRDVPAVTAACALIEAKLYRELGGFSEDYIVGDFEDSDLCLRAIFSGRRNYVALDVELYHLERQSQSRVGDAILRTNLTAYNCWLHNNRWAEMIQQIVTNNPMYAAREPS